MARLGEMRQRIDKWLYFARMVKSRSLAQACIGNGQVKINGVSVRQSSRFVSVDDRVEVSLERGDYTLVVKGMAETRRPYSEASLLYEDISPPREDRNGVAPLQQALRERGSGRPTKRDRRLTEALRLGIADDKN